MNKLGLWEQSSTKPNGMPGWDVSPRRPPHPLAGLTGRLNVICLGSNTWFCKRKWNLAHISSPLTGNLTSVTEWTSIIIKSSAFRFYCACNPNHSRRGVKGARLCWPALTVKSRTGSLPEWPCVAGADGPTAHQPNAHFSGYLCCLALSYSYITLTYSTPFKHCSFPLRGRVQI